MLSTAPRQVFAIKRGRSGADSVPFPRGTRVMGWGRPNARDLNHGNAL
jgi:hypothetical protein